ncbi:MAG: PHP domain-containing protein [Dehalococcoidia bacterium]|nr:PHP domain-containing protein [Dehalococcoidia bacterium]
MKVRLDLHTHIWEASGFQKPNLDWAAKVVQQAKVMGIDGIAITEHHGIENSHAYKRIIEENFPGQLLVFPGLEKDVHPVGNHFAEYQVGEFLLPNGRVFRNYCHPGYPSQEVVIENVQSIEIDNKLHNWHIDKGKVMEIAQRYGLLLTRVSDAHRLADIGTNYVEVELEEFYSLGTFLDGRSQPL